MSAHGYGPGASGEGGARPQGGQRDRAAAGGVWRPKAKPGEEPPASVAACPWPWPQPVLFFQGGRRSNGGGDGGQDALARFLAGLGPELEGREEAVGEALGSWDLQEVLELVEERADLRDLDRSGFSAEAVDRLFDAILKDKQLRSGEEGAQGEEHATDEDLVEATVQLEAEFCEAAAASLACELGSCTCGSEAPPAASESPALPDGEKPAPPSGQDLATADAGLEALGPLPLLRSSTQDSNASPASHPQPLLRTGTHESAASTASMTSAEHCISDVMRDLAWHSRAAYERRQALFDLVQAAAASRLGEDFERLVLVGGAALQIDTPSSDLDAVIFTHRGGGGPRENGGGEERQPGPEQQVEVLRAVEEELRRREPSLRVQVVACARVPVLTATSCAPDSASGVASGDLSIDVLADQRLPLEHWRWFERSWAGPPRPGPLQRLPSPIREADASSEALLLRCVKWWLARRELPGTKYGGFPKIVWLLMAAHVERHFAFGSAVGRKRRSRRLLHALASFFGHFGSEDSFHGTIFFDAAGAAHFQKLPPSERATASKAPDLAPEKCTVCVGGLPDELREQHVKEHFGKFGTVRTVCLVRTPPRGGSPASLAFVTFASPCEAALALGGGEQLVGGRRVKVGELLPEKQEARSLPVFWVGYLHRDVAERDVRSYFASFGDVREVSMGRSRERDGTWRFAFVTMGSAAAGDAIVASPSHRIGGWRVKVQLRKVAKGKDDEVTRPGPSSPGLSSYLLESFSVLDPTRPEDLAPKVSPATQLLHLYELQRAAVVLRSCTQRAAGGSACGAGGAAVRSLFEQVDEGTNCLPSSWPPPGPEPGGPAGVLFVLCPGGRLVLALGVLRGVRPKAGWTAPLMHRRDGSSRISASFLSVDDMPLSAIREGRGGAVCRLRRGSGGGEPLEASFAPCDFVCRVALSKPDGCPPGEKAWDWELHGEGLLRYRSMRRLLEWELVRNPTWQRLRRRGDSGF